MLTGSFTLDATNPAARREINQLGELLGAVRLPTGAHRRAAGTEALTDLLILQHRTSGELPNRSASWERTRELDVDGGSARINSYFIEHPDRVLGTLGVGRGMYGAHTLQVRPTAGLAEIPEQFAAQLADITQPRTRTRPPSRSDPFAALVRALEIFDETTQTAAPATLLSQSASSPPASPGSAPTHRRTRSRSASTPTAASSCGRSRACSAST